MCDFGQENIIGNDQEININSLIQIVKENSLIQIRHISRKKYLSLEGLVNSFYTLLSFNTSHIFSKGRGISYFLQNSTVILEV